MNHAILEKEECSRGPGVTSIIEGESVNFSDLSSGAITMWYWEFEGGTPATSTDQNPTITYNLEGVYDVSLTVSNGTSTNTSVKTDYIAVDHVTGISNLDGSGVNVFPNPSSGKVYFTGVQNASVKVYNATGTVVASFKELKDNTIDLSGVENGIYFISIEQGNNSILNQKISILK